MKLHNGLMLSLAIIVNLRGLRKGDFANQVSFSYAYFIIEM